MEVQDAEGERVAAAVTVPRIPLVPGEPITLSLAVRTERSGQPFTAALAFFDAQGRWIQPGANLDLEGVGEADWRRWRVTYRSYPEQARSVEVLLAATSWKPEQRGAAWFRDVDVAFGEPWREARGSPVGELAGAAVWSNRPEQRVRPELRPPTGEPAPVRLAALRGESECFQIAVRTGSAWQLDEVAIEPLSAGGHELSPDVFGLLEAVTVDVVRPSDPLGRRGPTPDPLPQLRLPWVPPPGRSSALFVTTRIPLDAPAGSYVGALVLRSGQERLRVPVELRVIDATLPLRPSRATAFDLPSDIVAAAHGVVGDPVGRAQIADRYLAAMARGRVGATDPMQAAPLDVLIPQWGWRGGRIVDADSRVLALRPGGLSPLQSEARTQMAVPLIPGETLELTFRARAKGDGAAYRAVWTLLDPYDREIGQVEQYLTESGYWRDRSLSLPPDRVPSGAVAALVRFVAVSDEVWLDTVSARSSGDPTEELIPNVGFEADVTALPLELWSVAFDQAADRALDQLGMRAFRVWLDGMAYGRRQERFDGALLGFGPG